MNLKIFILALSTVAVGLVELIIGGILPAVADDLNVSHASAGQLITAFALTYAIAGPVLLVMTSKIERKKLYLVSLFIFIVGNIFMFFSPNYTIALLSRIMTAITTGLIVALSLTLAARVVESAKQARALGLIYMGISSPLVLGIPIGILISDAFGWRMIFLGIAGLGLGSMILIALFLDPMPGKKTVPLSVQLKAITSTKIGSAHLATMFMLAAHYTIYAYFTPFLETKLNLNSNWVSLCYFIFGVAAVSGGAFGGTLSDKIGARKSIIFVLSAFALILLVLPFSAFSLVIFIPIMMIWAMLSWSLAPPQQSYLIQTDPATCDIQQSFNNSSIQVGVAIGSAIGGVMLNFTGNVSSNAWFGAVIAIVALLSAIFSLSRPAIRQENTSKSA